MEPQEPKKAVVSDTEVGRDRAAWAATLRQIREASNLDVPGAAELAGVCPKCVENSEKPTANPESQTLHRLCKAYGVPISVVAILVELRREGYTVPLKLAFRIARRLRRFFLKTIGF